MSYRPFSKDLWDYLGDMSYMPSRKDRDALVSAGETRRVRIWDYFFRIKAEDVGKPQKQEIEHARLDLEIEFRSHSEQINLIEGDIDRANREFERSLWRILVPGVVLLTLGSGVGAIGFIRPVYIRYVLYCSIPLWLIGMIMLVISLRTWLKTTALRERLHGRIDAINELQKRQVKAVRNRISVLEEEIEQLRRQIPKPPDDSQVRTWLNEDLIDLLRRCIVQTGLSDQMVSPESLSLDGVSIKITNPIPIMGPGELQDSKSIPRSFRRDEYPDLNKHLTARMAYVIPGDNLVDVLYGVYYIKYIVLCDSLMATYGFYYDFINGTQYAERETEQYYRDVVTIATTKESRQVRLGVDSDEYILVEDAPTFTLSLPSSETRTVTYVNENYFLGIRDKLGLTHAQVKQIFWVKDAERTVENTSLVLRQLVRKHKI